ncbi:hypothetical protein BGX34_003851 [Mortierella sp. NVP85]|nr:hypothetical protein BGX34_003851 [Mortierella sp. NVP85]
MYNALLPGSDKYMSEEAKEVAAEWIVERGKLDWNAKCFGDGFADYVQNCKTASAFADADQNMPGNIFSEVTDYEKDYMWRTILWQKWLWKVYSDKDTAMEGWLITYVYGPFMSIFMEIKGTLLRMTERKVSRKSMKFDLSKWPERSDYRHDALLRMEELMLDVMIVEAKPAESIKCEDDFKKLGIVLGNNILGMKDQFPAIKEDLVRANGIMFVGYTVHLLEARLKDGNPVLFALETFTIPKGDSTSDHKDLLHALRMFIAFAKRVRKNTKLISVRNGKIPADKKQ